jgi:hypothetical protein
MPAAVKILGQSLVKPSEYLRPMAQAVSSKPATTRRTHGMTKNLPFLGVVLS